MMKLTHPLVRELAVHAAALLILIAGGAWLVWLAQQTLAREKRSLGAVEAELRREAQRLSRVAEEAREVRDHIELYQRLKGLRILGDERRVEWIEALARIRAARELPELRYQVERQKVLKSLPGNPALELRSSTLKLELALLHEGDLLGFLEDLRASGHAYYSVRQCSIARTADAVPAATIAPRLRASCQIDLITLAEAKGGA
jgi:hypothetical protein